jgi:DeoR family transcriptional regulator, aga operon transcriptional repressor
MPSETNDAPPVDVRRQRILEVVGEHGFARVAELSAAFHVSDVTVRSDLDALDRAGAIRRVHGGAMLPGAPFALERSFEESLETSGEEKRSIGRLATDLVEPGSSVFVDVGTTTAAFARALVEREDLSGLTIVTNGLSIARELEPCIPRNQVIVTGGTLRPLQHSLVAPLASLVLEQLHVDVAVIGCNGVDRLGGVTNVNVAEAELKRLMVRRADRTIVVADGSKLGQIHLGRIAGTEEIAALVTGASAVSKSIEELRGSGLRVEVA